MVGQTVVANASMHSIWVLIDANQMHITEISDRLAKRYEESSARERSKKIDLEGGFGNKLWKANFKIDHENSSKDANCK
uniref:Uncharacterized protein n=1 Tax=Panagrolaimus davidi TaxID=227884 RepID=A0A914Q1Y0_9BILA